MIEQLFNDFGTKHLEEAKKNGVDLGLQNVYTPIYELEKATNFRFADYITSETRSVAVLFNTEFIGYFIKELPQNYINNIKFTFFYDCEFDYKQVRNFILFSGKRLNVDFVKIENIKDLDKVMAGKNFDIVYSNPPYSGIDLKILETLFINNSSNSIVWIAPVRWLQDPGAKYKRSTFNKFEKLGICKKIQKIKVISKHDAWKYFQNTQFAYDLGIIVICKNDQDNDVYKSLKNKIEMSVLDKVIGKTKTIKNFEETEQLLGNRVLVYHINGQAAGTTRALYYHYDVFKDGYTENNIFWTENGRNKNGASRKIGDPMPFSLNFNSLIEAKNYFKSANDDFLHFLNYLLQTDLNVPVSLLPCMIEETNPRTGLKGYEGEWTNEDFYKFFGITEEEQKYIEETMSQFK